VAERKHTAREHHGRGGLRKPCQEFGCGHDPYPAIEDILLSLKVDLVELRNVASLSKIAEGRTGTEVGCLALHRKPGPAFNGHEEINLPLTGVPQVMQVDPKPFLILDHVFELQEVGTHEVFKPGAFLRHRRPVPQVQFRGLLERSNGPMAEGGDPVTIIQPFQDIEPMGNSPVADLQIFPEGLKRKEIPCPLLQHHGQGLHGGQVPNILQIADIFPEKTVQFLPLPPSPMAFILFKKGFRKGAIPKQGRQGVGFDPARKNDFLPWMDCGRLSG